ncbi:hypothetical protein GCM10022140_46720 [Rhodococcus aetherivorans]
MSAVVPTAGKIDERTAETGADRADETPTGSPDGVRTVVEPPGPQRADRATPASTDPAVTWRRNPQVRTLQRMRLS